MIRLGEERLWVVSEVVSEGRGEGGEGEASPLAGIQRGWQHPWQLTTEAVGAHDLVQGEQLMLVHLRQDELIQPILLCEDGAALTDAASHFVPILVLILFFCKSGR